MGLPEFLIAAVSLAIPVWALIDASRRPESVWTAAGHNKTLWTVLLVVGLFLFGLGIIAALVYLISIRPKLNQS